LAVVRNTHRLAGLPFLIYGDEHRELLVRVASDKLFHKAAAPPNLGVSLGVYAKPCCSAFIASISVLVLSGTAVPRFRKAIDGEIDNSGVGVDF